MKTKLFIFIALVTGILLATAEERPYRPMFEDGHTWITEHIPDRRRLFDGEACLIRGYIVNGDTLIGGKMFKRICEIETMKPVCFGLEEDRRVYIRCFDAYYSGVDEYNTYLMADFGISKGDSIACYDEWDDKRYYQYCIDEDYINYDGEIYRRITMNSGDKLIEGVGWHDLWHSIYPGIPISMLEYSRRFIRSYQDGKWVKASAFSMPGVPADSVVYNPNHEVR